MFYLGQDRKSQFFFEKANGLPEQQFKKNYNLNYRKALFIWGNKYISLGQL